MVCRISLIPRFSHAHTGETRLVTITNAILSESKHLLSCSRFTPYTKFTKCKICKQTVHQAGSHYCQGMYHTHLLPLTQPGYTSSVCVPMALPLCVAGCAYKKGICAMCGKQILDVKDYKQSSV